MVLLRRLQIPLLLMDLKSTQEKASDAELPGPGSSVTDLSVSQGVFVDDSDRPRNAKQDAIRFFVPLHEGGSQCALCAERGVDTLYLNIKDLADHLAAHHVRATVQWTCVRCEKSFPKIHGWRCHYVKCKGTPGEQSARPFKCQICSESFEKQVGLSMHERHMHPALRNRKRMELAEKPKKVPGRRANVWTPEEVKLLIELDARFRDAKFPNIEIQTFLPSKTADQIRNKRKDLPKLVRQHSPKVPSMDDEEASTSSGAPIIGNEMPDEAIEEVAADDSTAELWLEDIKKVIQAEARVSNDIKAIYNDLMAIWFAGHNDISKLSEDIENFIAADLTPFLLKEDKDKNKHEKIKNNKNNSKNNRKDRVTRGGNKERRNARRRYEYARSQELYTHCPKKLANMILKDDMIMVNPPHPLPADRSIEELYTHLWGTAGPVARGLDAGRREEPLPLSLMSPFGADEVEGRIRVVKIKSAAGPDGIRKTNLNFNKQGISLILSKVYNILLYAGYYPKCWKINRTTLIPKAGKDLNDVKNWRPITIGSLMGRIFSALIDRRLRAMIKNHARQKGFTSENGCKQNVVLLAEAIQRSKASNGGVFSILDISKAFDTVPHSAIEAALRRKRIPSRICKYICSMYSDCSTAIRSNGPQAVNIQIRRGVKQGDPLSPLLFNLCIDKLIGDIETSTNGLAISADKSISILAFADDLVLLSSDVSEAQQQLRMVSNCLDSLGMSLSVNKCGSFMIKTMRDSWYVKTPEINIGRDRVPKIDPEEMFSYLGAKFGPWRGLHKGLIVPDIIGTIKRIRTLALKPYQKADLFLSYVLPHFIYNLVISPPSDSTLKLLDSEIRQEIKEILHLMPSTAMGFFYTPKNSGGLGIPRLEHVVKLATLKNGIKMLSSEDDAIREVMLHENEERKLRAIANSLRINWPATLMDIESAKKRLKAEEAKSWSELRSQGQGVRDYCNDKIGNYWLQHPSVLKASRYIDALRLRTNTYGTRVVLARANKHMDVTCRRCHTQPETIGHVLGLCIHTKQLRIKRHDEVKNFIFSKLAPSKPVTVEPTLNINGRLFKPDLIIKSENKAFIVDVTVRYEHRDYLQVANKEKKEKYAPCLENIRQQMMCSESEVLPVVIGSRGAMPRDTVENLKILGLKKNDILTIALNVLRSSIEIANIFIDYDV